MSKPVRVRFAPSPTGALHIGGIRTALFNFLFAKKHNGVFFLRIEDTDQTRFDPQAEQYIFDSLRWLGIEPSETVDKNEKFGPYRQSERKAIYAGYIAQLIETGHAYYAFDTAADLDGLRKSHEATGNLFTYSHSNRKTLNNSIGMSAAEVAQNLANGAAHVVRFKTPENEILELEDEIRGKVQFNTAHLDDKILFKSDGLPTYHFANIVDDHLMETSHVIRGEEWLPSLPLHVMLYRAFGWDAPVFAHLPLILKPIGNGKLSKRDGEKLGFPVFPITWTTADGTIEGYREKGFFPEAVINFLAMLGWNDGTEQEIFPLTELIEKFDLKKVHKAGAKFDPEKNKWFNHHYLQQQKTADLVEIFDTYLTVNQKANPFDHTTLNKIVELVKPRAHFAADLWDLTNYFFEAPTIYDSKASKNWTIETSDMALKTIAFLENITTWNAKELSKIIKEWQEIQEIPLGKLMQMLRISAVGSLQGIDVFEILGIIGQTETIARIQKAIDHHNRK